MAGTQIQLVHRNSTAHRFLIGLLIEGLTKNSHNKEVDDEGHR